MPDKLFSAFCSEPSEHECWVAIWSNGRACKTCVHSCYRAGWFKSQVDADNLHLIKQKLESLH